ncbi:MAG: hypothetical protein AABY83_10795 [Pseudomonadota bacterium]
MAIADDAIIYNPGKITLGSHTTVSTQAYLCGATHDYNDAAFPMYWAPIHVGAYAWICARATVQWGTVVGTGAVLALGAIATKDLDPWSVYAGIPARKIKQRNHNGRC